ncbi:MAG TPA: Hpt domain-containing protein, partial [Blastocatellia bacterium]
MDDFTNDELEQLMAVFKDQAGMILDEMSHNLLLLEADPSDSQTMAQLRRSAHTIKGDSACIGLDRITELAHRVEDVIEAVRDGELDLDAPVVDALLQCVDQIRLAVCGGEVQDLGAEELERMLAAISRIEFGIRGRAATRPKAESEPAADAGADAGA